MPGSYEMDREIEKSFYGGGKDEHES